MQEFIEYFMLSNLKSMPKDFKAVQ